MISKTISHSHKVCVRCGGEKPLADFYPRYAKCKDCTKAQVRAHRAANVERYRAYDLDRANLPHRKANATRVIGRWMATNPARRAAQTAVNNAVRDGRLSRLPCWICGERAEAHHPDYASPLDVVWLCPAHHKQLHAECREAA